MCVYCGIPGPCLLDHRGARAMQENAAALVAAGFVRDPNVRGEWYAGGPDIMEPAYPLRIRERGDVLALVVMPYGKFNHADAVDVFRFADADDLFAHLARHARPSEPGLPAYSNSWD